MRPTTTNEPDPIYVSKDDKIVIDGLLCYMVHKLHVLNQDALEKVIVSGYSNDAIRASKEKLFKVCPGQRYVGHTGEAAATKHVRDMIKLLQERGTAIPTLHGCSLTPSTHPKYTRGSFRDEGTDGIVKSEGQRAISEYWRSEVRREQRTGEQAHPSLSDSNYLEGTDPLHYLLETQAAPHPCF
ncbi:hypothetical protein CAPTEDRAFT_185162 [Capitella teleta]|uniref:Uncharacterized protein n=1 Tax=Capitella teleta TaxID=283909 RepID=R7UA38_CAPTE|nr:hypothetical protein CAPTEDRAFT_185162 [Capitella teleta]|eukprot:ELU02844.1 hypothetical protein CAPTEDRAFT_185162 [Capitella teleta]